MERRMYQWPGPGKVDNEGIEWFACDPYITWYRWEDGELYTDPPPELKLTDEEYEAAKESNRKYWSEDEHTL